MNRILTLILVGLVAAVFVLLSLSSANANASGTRNATAEITNQTKVNNGFTLGFFSTVNLSCGKLLQNGTVVSSNPEVSEISKGCLQFLLDVVTNHTSMISEMHDILMQHTAFIHKMLPALNATLTGFTNTTGMATLPPP